MLEFFANYIIQFIEKTSYFGIFILMTLESALIPIPSEITMPFSGFLSAQGKLSFWLIVATGAFANLTGSLIAYGIGFYLEEHIILSLIKKYGKFLLLTVHEYERSLTFLRRHGDQVAFFSRLLPGVRTFISLPCGLSEMNVLKFSIYTFLGSLIWAFFLTYVGVILGENWNAIEGFIRRFEIVVAVILVLAVAFYIERKLGLRKSLRRKS